MLSTTTIALAERHPLGYALFALLACLLALSALGAATENALAPTTAAALLACVFYVAAEGLDGVRPVSAAGESKRWAAVALSVVAVAVLAAGTFVLAGGCDGAAAGGADASALVLGEPASSSLATFGVLVQFCLLTAVFEEVLFRGVLYRRFRVWQAAHRDDGHRSFAHRALVAQALVFALLHLSPFVPEGTLPPGAQAGVLVGRFAAAFFFAILMARLCETRWSLALPILVHFLYDLVLFAPLAWSQGIMRANVLAGGMPDAISVAIQAVCLAVVVLACARRDSCYHTRSES